MCFTWSILATIYPAAKHRERISKYRQNLSSLNMTGIAYPVSVNCIIKFETQNLQISINVFACEDRKDVFLARITQVKNRMYHVNLLNEIKNTTVLYPT